MQRPVGMRLTHKITSFGWLKRVLSYLISRRSRNILCPINGADQCFLLLSPFGATKRLHHELCKHCWPRSAAGSTIDWCRRRSFNMFTIRQARRVTLTAKNRILVVTRYSVVKNLSMWLSKLERRSSFQLAVVSHADTRHKHNYRTDELYLPEPLRMGVTMAASLAATETFQSWTN